MSCLQWVLTINAIFRHVFHEICDLPLSSYCPGEGNGTPPQYSCLENPMDRGAWWAAVHGVAQSRTPPVRENYENRYFFKGRKRCSQMNSIYIFDTLSSRDSLINLLVYYLWNTNEIFPYRGKQSLFIRIKKSFICQSICSWCLSFCFSFFS